MRRRPGHGLHADVDAGVLPLELGHHLRDHLALGAHRPEAKSDAVVSWFAAGEGEPDCHPKERSHPSCHPERSEGSAFRRLHQKQIPRRYAPRDDRRECHWSHPPVKPARCNPRRMYGL